MIWIIGGTTETRQVIRELEGKKDYVVTVATYSGAEMLNGQKVVVGRMNLLEMLDFVRRNHIDTILDMSHPYATEVTQNAVKAGKESGIKYIRYSRKCIELDAAIRMANVESCCAYLKCLKGTVFFTTGIKNIKDFEQARGSNRFIYRVLPSVFSIEECVKNHVKMEDIVAILGPVSEDLNYHMFREYGVEYVVLKDSGSQGGTPEKLAACKKLGIAPILIGRQLNEEGFDNVEDLLDCLLQNN